MTNSLCLLNVSLWENRHMHRALQEQKGGGNGAGAICIPLPLPAAVLFCPFLASCAVSQVRSGSTVLLLGCGDGGPPPCLRILEPAAPRLQS